MEFEIFLWDDVDGGLAGATFVDLTLRVSSLACRVGDWFWGAPGEIVNMVFPGSQHSLVIVQALTQQMSALAAVIGFSFSGTSFWNVIFISI